MIVVGILAVALLIWFIYGGNKEGEKDKAPSSIVWIILIIIVIIGIILIVANGPSDPNYDMPIGK